MCRISVVLVCLNAEKVIKKTLESILEQSYESYELVVKDGLSIDKTLEIVSFYSDQIKNVKIISDKDSGIYDAMNQAVVEAQGEYIYFLNAGDCLYSEKTLENVASQLDRDIVYGDMIYGKEKLCQVEKLTKVRFMFERMLCHQSIFAKKELLLKYPFECKYKYCADRHWLYTCVKKNVSIKHINEVIGFYDTTGVSSEWSNFSNDSLNVIKDEFGLLGVVLAKIKRKVGQLLKFD